MDTLARMSWGPRSGGSSDLAPANRAAVNATWTTGMHSKRHFVWEARFTNSTQGCRTGLLAPSIRLFDKAGPLRSSLSSLRQVAHLHAGPLNVPFLLSWSTFKALLDNTLVLGGGDAGVLADEEWSGCDTLEAWHTPQGCVGHLASGQSHV